MKMALAQINTTVGDLDGNRDRIVARIAEARDAGADLVVFPELAITGYPPEDLLLRPAFVRAAAEAAGQVAQAATGIVALVGAPHAEDGRLYNACLVCADGGVAGRLPQAAAAELRRVRREALFRAGHGASACSSSAKRRSA